ncbi:uncharacterized protein LOC126549901 [Aphis gossypii]|uniref:uncharacterized protein LOC126549901 n=1 Tax=Aphis gossypii TaxID=80765 RepID=UPI00215925D1|nr:uncharacterized protein LOC126549901 [Aphis gossypii]
MIRNLEELELDGNENRRFYTAENALDDLNDRQFIKKFRLPKQNVRDRIHELSPFMIHPTRCSAISIERQVLTALRFYASGSYQQDIGENRASSMSQSAVSQCITEVTEALNQPLVFSKHVYFPRTIEELNIVRQKFYEKYRIPGIIGIVDGTHIAIEPPKSEADSGYALRPWMITPLHDPQPNTPEADFNKWFLKIRSLIERCNGVLKMRFCCLLKHRVLHYEPLKASKIINACVVLHNICIDNNVSDDDIICEDDMIFDEDDLGVIPNINNEQMRAINPLLVAGRDMQRTIIQQYFT